MIYDVDTERIEAQLGCLEQCLDVMERSRNEWKGKSEEVIIFAASRALHIGVECVIDIGSTMIDGFMMRDPGGYLDIIDILEDEKVIPTESVSRLKELIRFRERLVRYYHEVSEDELIQELSDIAVLVHYMDWVRSYLRWELGERDPSGAS
ncbi:DUF86 domain-containing protein [Melghirimyces algeriensis]|nr:HepT-like ribonuclease domain-containing protein [Melghirimyces algeriensis]